MSRVIFIEGPASIPTPSSGRYTLQAADSGSKIDLFWKRDDGTEYNITDALTPPIFGTEYQSAEDDSSSTTTLTAYQEKLKLTTTSLPAGDYKIEWNYQWSHNDGANDFLGRVQIDDTTDLMLHQQEPKDVGGAGPGGTDQQHQLSGFAIRTLTAGVHEIDIDFATSAAGDISEILRARIVIYRVA